MEEQTAQQAQGAVELLRDAVQAGARSIGAAHQEIADLPYAILRCIPVVSRPASAIGQVQTKITRAAYRSVGVVTGIVAAGAALLIQAAAANRPAAPREQ